MTDSRRPYLGKDGAEEILRKIGGQNPLTAEIKEMTAAAEAHDFDDPLCITKVTIRGVEYTFHGNQAFTRTYGHNENIYINHEGNIETNEISIDKKVDEWRKEFERRQWTVNVEKGKYLTKSDCDEADGNAKIACIRQIPSYSNRYQQDEILIIFPCIRPGGKRSSASLEITSYCSGSRIADKVFAHIENARKAMPEDMASARNMSVKIATEIIESELARKKEKIPYSFALTNDWREGRVTLETHDNLLKPEKRSITIKFTRCLRAGIKMEEDSERDIARIISTAAARAKNTRTHGVVASGLARNIFSPGDEKSRKLRRSIRGKIEIKEKMTIRDGLIGAEVIIERDGERLIRITNNMFEMPANSVPLSVRTVMPGTPLKTYVHYEGLDETMIIEKVKVEGKMLRGRFSDRKIPWS